MTLTVVNGERSQWPLGRYLCTWLVPPWEPEGLVLVILGGTHLVGCGEQGARGESGVGWESTPSAPSYFWWPSRLLNVALIDLFPSLEGHCGRHRLLLPTQRPLPASWSQHFASSLRTHPTFVHVVSGFGTRVTEIWPIDRSHLLGHSDWFRAWPGWTNQSHPQDFC